MGKKKSKREKPIAAGPTSAAKPLGKHILSSRLEDRNEAGSTDAAETVLVPESERPLPAKSFPVVGIGASAGGLEALASFLKSLPGDTGGAFVVVQHMDPRHESMLPVLLARSTPMPVAQVTDGMTVEPNHVYVIPPNTEMTIHGGVLRLIGRPDGTAAYTPIDAFLCSLAEDQREGAFGIILSGIGSDGTRGLQAIKGEGGVTLAQDEESSKFSGMPLHAVAAGCVDVVLPPNNIAQELARVLHYSVAEVAARAELFPSENGSLKRILRLVRSAAGVDFTDYKQTTIRRRIARRALLRRCDTLAEYAKYAGEHPDEVSTLFEDLLIHVTSFFRDPEVLQYLRSTVFPRIFATLESGEPIRIWVPGCSSGEEAYSIAILLNEFLGDNFSQTRIQIFGTDVSEADIQKARIAIYSESIIRQVSPERLRRFFVKVEGGYQISKSIRDLCVFARHDVTKDPPFSRMEIISCRNLMIYLAPVLQKKVLSYFHYALKPKGSLVLGKSEGVSAAASLFLLEDHKASVYAKVASPGHTLTKSKAAELPKMMAGSAIPPLPPPTFDLRKEAERIILERYSPPALVVDSNMEIVHFQGDTSPFLKPAPGEASLNVLKLVRPELMFEVRRTIQESKKSATTILRENIRFKRNGDMNLIDLEVVPIEGRLEKGADFVVLFSNERPSPAEKGRSASGRKEEAKEIEQLRRELASAQENLRALAEDHEAAAEELRAANEEVLSSNEELQSTNEELETAKEELQSSNEELTTLNEELQNRNVELAQTTNDLKGLLDTVEIPIAILGNDRTLRRVTPAAAKLLNLVPHDVGRPISQIRPSVDIPDLDRLASDVVQSGLAQEREVRDRMGHWYALRIRPYTTEGSRIEGLLITVVDINDVKQFSTAIVDNMRAPLVVLDFRFRVISANPSFYQTFQLTREGTESQILFEVDQGQWNIPQLREVLDGVVREKRTVVALELTLEFPSIGQKTLLLDVHQLYSAERETGNILLIIEDISERKRAEADRALQRQELQELLARLLSATEDERKNMARELHDAFGQKLALLNLRVGEIEPLIPAQPELAAEKLHACREQIGAVAQEIQEFSRTLHPAALRELGLEVALRGECDGYAHRTGATVHFSADNIPGDVPEDIAICLYRIAQESLQNIWKHAESNRVDVMLRAANEDIELVVEDFGKGFDVESGKDKKGLGLISMQERVLLVGGSLSLKAKAGDGTRVEVRIPLRSRP